MSQPSNIQRIPVGEFHFDHDNPRLAEFEIENATLESEIPFASG